MNWYNILTTGNLHDNANEKKNRFVFDIFFPGKLNATKCESTTKVNVTMNSIQSV